MDTIQAVKRGGRMARTRRMWEKGDMEDEARRRMTDGTVHHSDKNATYKKSDPQFEDVVGMAGRSLSCLGPPFNRIPQEFQTPAKKKSYTVGPKCKSQCLARLDPQPQHRRDPARPYAATARIRKGVQRALCCQVGNTPGSLKPHPVSLSRRLLLASRPEHPQHRSCQRPGLAGTQLYW